MLLGCVYRHPRQQTQIFVDELCKKLSYYVDKNIQLIIFGDIDIDASNRTNKETADYNNTLLSIGCQNMIDQHTRVAARSRTLDHI